MNGSVGAMTGGLRLRPAVFIDKDGTLIEDLPYNVDPERLVFSEGAQESLRWLSDAGLPIVVISNQAGLALGRFGMEEFSRLRHALHERLRKEAGVQLAGMYICPHAPLADGTPKCECRKPNPGLLLRAAREQALDLSRSVMVGDILDDVEAGRRAGCRTVLLDVGHETEWIDGPLRRPDARVLTLREAARSILEWCANDRTGDLESCRSM